MTSLLVYEGWNGMEGGGVWASAWMRRGLGFLVVWALVGCLSWIQMQHNLLEFRLIACSGSKCRSDRPHPYICLRKS